MKEKAIAAIIYVFCAWKSFLSGFPANVSHVPHQAKLIVQFLNVALENFFKEHFNPLKDNMLRGD